MDTKTRHNIEVKLSRLRETESQQGFIYKVHEHLRNVNQKAYEPDILAIGPYHRDKDSCKMMEEHKWRYLQSLLSRMEETTPRRYILAIEKLEEQARNCYAEPINLDSGNFILLLVLDGCFIIELLLRRLKYYDLVDTIDLYSDPIFHTEWMMNTLERDMMLFENQIPFFVLSKLFEMIEESDQQIEQHNKLVDLLSIFFQNLLPGAENVRQERRNMIDTRHLPEVRRNMMDPYDLLHTRRRDIMDTRHFPEVRRNMMDPYDLLHTRRRDMMDTRHLLDLIHRCWIPESLANAEVFNVTKHKHNIPGQREWRFINSAAELKVANVKFQKMMKSSDTNLFEVQFQNGTILMQPFIIENRTECVLRNLIVYEQNFPFDRHSYITDYATFLDRLINSSKDVDILSECGIIDNWLGDNEVIANVFNHITDAIVGHSPGKIFAYAETFENINAHYNKRWNRSLALLKRDYFSSPWAKISFVAAFFLLLFTIVQTVCSVLQIT